MATIKTGKQGKTVRRITKSAVDALIEKGVPGTIRDDKDAGFQARLNRNGTVTYLFEYKARPGRGAKVCRLKVGIHGLMTADAARKIAKVHRANVVRGEDPAKERAKARATPTLAEVAEEFFAERGALAERQGKKADIRASTLQNYRSYWRCHIAADLGSRRIDTITRSDVDRLHRKISLERRVTANRARMFLYTLFREAAYKEHVPEDFNPARPFRNGRKGGNWNVEPKRKRYLSIDEIFALERTITVAETSGFPISFDRSKATAKHIPKMAAAQLTTIDKHAAAALRLLILTGARLREVLHAKWDDVKFDRAMMVREGKGKGAREIFLSPEAIAILERLPRDSANIFPGADTRKPRSDLNRPWALVREHAGLADVRIHDLRHSFAAMAARNGISLQTIGAAMGHNNVTTTARYAHLDDAVTKSAVAQTAAAISRAMAGEPQAEVIDFRTVQTRGKR